MHPLSKNIYPVYHLSLFKESKTFGYYIFDASDYFSKYPLLKEKHALNVYSIIYVQSGEGFLEIDDEKIIISSQQLFMISPNQTQLIKPKSNFKAFIILFCQDFYLEEYDLTRLLKVFIPSLSTSINKISPYILLKEEAINIDKIVSLMFAEYNQENINVSTTILRSYLNALLIKINQLNLLRSSKDFDYNNEIIINFSQLVENNFIKQQDLSFYASELKISETKINKIVKSHFNSSIKKIIHNRLMLEARKLLCNSNFTVAEVSIHLNFSDNSYFNKVFIKHHTITPGQFRSLHQKYTINRN
ncbi:MAG: AraC family transcriptional regulator [Bacteroidota bacterium]